MMPQIYIAAAFASLISLLVIGGWLMRRGTGSDRTFYMLLIIVMLPMNALAYHAVRLPLDRLLQHFTGDTAALLRFIRLWHAPLTEEPAKLWPLLVPAIYRRITGDNLARTAVAIGLGFGVGEIWNVAFLLHESGTIARYPWYQLGGFINERFLVCIMHAGFVAVALRFIVLHRKWWLGILLGVSLHFAGNFPIFLAHWDAFSLGKEPWQVILQVWILLYFFLMLGTLFYFLYGKEWRTKLVQGTMKCPGCSRIYRRPLWGINLYPKRYEPCPHCGRWHLVSARDYREDEEEKAIPPR